MWYCTAIKKPTNIIDKPPTSAQYWQQKQAQHAIPRPRHLNAEELTNILSETCYVTKNSALVLGRGCCLWVFDTWRNCQIYDRRRGTSIKQITVPVQCLSGPCLLQSGGTHQPKVTRTSISHPGQQVQYIGSRLGQYLSVSRHLPPPRTSTPEHHRCDPGKHWMYYMYDQISQSFICKKFLL